LCAQDNDLDAIGEMLVGSHSTDVYNIWTCFCEGTLNLPVSAKKFFKGAHQKIPECFPPSFNSAQIALFWK